MRKCHQECMFMALNFFDEKDYYAVVELDMPSKAGPKFQLLGRF